MTNISFNGSSIPESLAKSVDRRIVERLPNIPIDMDFTVKSLLGAEFWAQIGLSQRSNVGKYFSYRVESGSLDLMCTNLQTKGTKNYIKQ